MYYKPVDNSVPAVSISRVQYHTVQVKLCYFSFQICPLVLWIDAFKADFLLSFFNSTQDDRSYFESILQTWNPGQ